MEGSTQQLADVLDLSCSTDNITQVDDKCIKIEKEDGTMEYTGEPDTDTMYGGLLISGEEMDCDDISTPKIRKNPQRNKRKVFDDDLPEFNKKKKVYEMLTPEEFQKELKKIDQELHEIKTQKLLKTKKNGSKNKSKVVKIVTDTKSKSIKDASSKVKKPILKVEVPISAPVKAEMVIEQTVVLTNTHDNGEDENNKIKKQTETNIKSEKKGKTVVKKESQNKQRKPRQERMYKRKYACNRCDSSFNGEKYLADHIRLTHGAKIFVLGDHSLSMDGNDLVGTVGNSGAVPTLTESASSLSEGAPRLADTVQEGHTTVERGIDNVKIDAHKTRSLGSGTDVAIEEELLNHDINEEGSSVEPSFTATVVRNQTETNLTVCEDQLVDIPTICTETEESGSSKEVLLIASNLGNNFNVSLPLTATGSHLATRHLFTMGSPMAPRHLLTTTSFVTTCSKIQTEPLLTIKPLKTTVPLEITEPNETTCTIGTNASCITTTSVANQCDVERKDIVNVADNNYINAVSIEENIELTPNEDVKIRTYEKGTDTNESFINQYKHIPNIVSSIPTAEVSTETVKVIECILSNDKAQDYANGNTNIKTNTSTETQTLMLTDIETCEELMDHASRDNLGSSTVDNAGLELESEIRSETETLEALCQINCEVPVDNDTGVETDEVSNLVEVEQLIENSNDKEADVLEDSNNVTKDTEEIEAGDDDNIASRSLIVVTDSKKNIACLCPFCENKFSTPKCLKAHIEKSCKHPPYRCYCGQGLIRENQEHHHAKPRKKVNRNTIETKYECSKCLDRFVFEETFKNHRQLCENDDSKKNRVVCEICNKVYHKEYFSQHMQMHENKREFLCDKCSKAFNTKTQLKKHVDTVHKGTNKRSYQCEYCSVAFYQKSNLENHQNVLVGKCKSDIASKVQYECSVCKKLYTSLGRLSQHSATHKFGNILKPYKCTFCEKAFKNQGGLVRHVKIHTNDKPYKCSECPAAFIQRGNLDTHERTHSRKTPYKCSFCEKHFNQKTSLNNHLNSKHLDEQCVEREREEIFVTNTIAPEEKKLEKLEKILYKRRRRPSISYQRDTSSSTESDFDFKNKFYLKPEPVTVILNEGMDLDDLDTEGTEDS